MEAHVSDRSHTKLMLKKEVIINNSVKGYALEISEEDMLIYAHIPFPPGMLLDLSFTLAEGQPPMMLQARVQSVQADVGVGVVFVDAGQADQERLKRFIEENALAHPLKEECPVSERRKRILLVDDSAAARTTYKNKLVLSCYSVKEASSGMEAIKAIAEENPDLILLDMQMEGMDGTKFLQFLRSNDAWKNIKVIMLSGRITAQEAERVAAFGVSDILSKMTTTPNKLAERVKQVLGS